MLREKADIMRQSLLLMCLCLWPTVGVAQLTYEQRAAFAKDQTFIDRVGVAAQQQSVIAQGENPPTCCQTSAQEALAPGASTLCSLVIPPGSPTAPDYVKAKSVDRHNARARLAVSVAQNPSLWAQRFAASIASDTCVVPPFTDAQLQAYMTRMWDLWALSPELAATATAQAATQQGVVALPPSLR